MLFGNESPETLNERTGGNRAGDSCDTPAPEENSYDPGRTLRTPGTGRKTGAGDAWLQLQLISLCGR